MDRIRIGTRGSALALWQAEWIKSQLQALYGGLQVELVRIKTTGDKIQDVPLARIGGKGLFIKEIEEALIREDIDIAVHSMKDMPVKLPTGLCIAAITEREDPRDALISRNGVKLADLPDGAKIGTGSLRRHTQLMNYRPDLKIISLRGNIDTRIKKLESEGLDAIVLAAAGLRRMGWREKISETVDPDILLPAIGQGAVGIEARRYDTDVMQFIVDLDHDATHTAVDAERAFLEVLEGGCQVPIGAYATIDGKGELTLRGLVGNLDGTVVHKSEIKGAARRADALGRNLAEELLQMGAAKILKEIYG
ncbi:MAG: hydroxymethylbilane synthase [Nitrospinales bacterium]